jgi:predicted homoserine dehydrogenase-like protein
VTVVGNGNGMAFANGAKAMVSRSLIANNTGNAIESDNISGGSGTEVALDTSTVSNNGTGLFTFGGGVLDVSNSNIAFNAQGASGAWFSFGNNRVHRNTAPGTLPTAIGALTHDLGQQ